ncbi:Retrotransposable element Tf2 [Sesbania bispinosa]|nr:Retrotransposable element Tf2 [Sesbania bispinosa]
MGYWRSVHGDRDLVGGEKKGKEMVELGLRNGFGLRNRKRGSSFLFRSEAQICDDDAITYQKRNGTALLSGVKMIPRFDGKNAYWWLINVEQYFDGRGIPEEEKLSWAWLAMEGQEEIQWWYHWKSNKQDATWWDFVKALLKNSNQNLILIFGFKKRDRNLGSKIT